MIVMTSSQEDLGTKTHEPSWPEADKLDAKRPSSGARKPIEDIEPARNGPRLPEGSTRTGYDRFER